MLLRERSRRGEREGVRGEGEGQKKPVEGVLNPK